MKEYGEGVDRMCKELEAIGLPDPIFNNNTFILKTTVMSASFEGKSTDHASIRPENASTPQNDASIQGKDALIERLIQMEAAGRVLPKDAADARAVITGMEILQVITSKEVMRILSCQTTKARTVLKMMERNGLIKTTQGKGKGKYILYLSATDVWTSCSNAIILLMWLPATDLSIPFANCFPEIAPPFIRTGSRKRKKVEWNRMHFADADEDTCKDADVDVDYPAIVL